MASSVYKTWSWQASEMTDRICPDSAPFYTQPIDPIYALHPKKEKKLSHLLHPWAHLLQLDPITILHLQQDFFPDFTFNPTLPPLLTRTLLSFTLIIFLINHNKHLLLLSYT